jgi:hypothetical protein
MGSCKGSTRTASHPSSDPAAAMGYEVIGLCDGTRSASACVPLLAEPRKSRGNSDRTVNGRIQASNEVLSPWRGVGINFPHRFVLPTGRPPHRTLGDWLQNWRIICSLTLN